MDMDQREQRNLKGFYAYIYFHFIERDTNRF